MVSIISLELIKPALCVIDYLMVNMYYIYMGRVNCTLILSCH
jgi:hypothetical protein